jgi:hypothetical protein
VLGKSMHTAKPHPGEWMAAWTPCLGQLATLLSGIYSQDVTRAAPVPASVLQVLLDPCDPFRAAAAKIVP